MKSKIVAASIFIISAFMCFKEFATLSTYNKIKKANDLLEKKEYEKARKEYEDIIKNTNLQELKGNILKSYYQEGKYDEVIKYPYDEHFLKGNSYVYVGEKNQKDLEKDLNEALTQYKEAIPSCDDINIKKNYEIVLKKLEQNQKQQQQNQDNKKDKKQDKKDQNQQNNKQNQKDNKENQDKQNQNNQNKDNQNNQQQNNKNNQEQNKDNKQNNKDQNNKNNKDNNNSNNNQNNKQQDKKEQNQQNNNKNDNKDKENKDKQSQNNNKEDDKKNQDNKQQNNKQQKSNQNNQKQNKDKQQGSAQSSGDVKPTKEQIKEQEVRAILKRLEGNEKQAFKNNERYINISDENNSNRW